MIAAADENNALGKDNDLLWHLPDDFKRFKALTTGHYIIMGRKTFESFPRPLPNRKHLILTRDKNYDPGLPDCSVVHNLKQALTLTKEDTMPFIIGGGEIYSLAMPYCDAIELTRVHAQFEADTHFPDIDPKEWQLLREEFHPMDERHAHSFTYRTYQRIP
ncbi:MAG: dihydrofolate reductase [Sediminicola sp.]